MMKPTPEKLYNLYKYLVNLLARLINAYYTPIQKKQGILEITY